MLLGVDTVDNLRIDPLRIQRPLAAIVGVAIVALMITAIVSTRELSAFPSTEPGPTNTPTPAGEPDANIKDLAENLFSTHVFTFEFTSVLLVVAFAGTVVLTRRQRRTHEDAGS
jgi:NADH-quinone oxidoreductase subunit J